jgi:hypothetical protein
MLKDKLKNIIQNIINQSLTNHPGVSTPGFLLLKA